MLAEAQKGAALSMWQRYGEFQSSIRAAKFLEQKLGAVHWLTCEFRLTILKAAEENFAKAQKVFVDAEAVQNS